MTAEPVHPLPLPTRAIRISDATDDGPDDAARARRLDWAKLFKRVFAVDVLWCPRCRSPMRMIAFVDDERIARRILEHAAPARGASSSRSSTTPRGMASIRRTR